MRRLMELCPVVGVGIRSLSFEEQVFVKEKGLRYFAPGDIPIADVLASLSARVYITIDLDVLDPAIMSAVGSPEPGGLGWGEQAYQAQPALHGEKIRLLVASHLTTNHLGGTVTRSGFR